MPKSDGAHLSKNVLQMKFMQRSVLRMEKEQNEEEQQKVIDDEHWVLELQSYKTKDDKFQKGLSYVFCEELEFGRQSYNGFNPEIEKLMKAHDIEDRLTKSAEVEKRNSVSDQDMANRYSTLMGVVAKKFAKKRQRSQLTTGDEEVGASPPVKKFLKPVDVDDD